MAPSKVLGYETLGPAQKKIIGWACKNAVEIKEEFFVDGLDTIARARLGYGTGHVIESLERWGCLVHVDNVRKGKYNQLVKRHKIVLAE